MSGQVAGRGSGSWEGPREPRGQANTWQHHDCQSQYLPPPPPRTRPSTTRMAPRAPPPNSHMFPKQLQPLTVGSATTVLNIDRVATAAAAGRPTAGTLYVHGPQPCPCVHGRSVLAAEHFTPSTHRAPRAACRMPVWLLLVATPRRAPKLCPLTVELYSSSQSVYMLRICMRWH